MADVSVRWVFHKELCTTVNLLTFTTEENEYQLSSSVLIINGDGERSQSIGSG